MPWQKGKSGNPEGRKAGVPTVVGKYREMLAEHLPNLIDVVVQKAKDGDGAALKVVFDRVLPALRSRETLVTLQGLKSDDSLCNQAETVVEALSSGQITPSESASIMQTLQGRARLIETEELIERVEALERGYKHS